MDASEGEADVSSSAEEESEVVLSAFLALALRFAFARRRAAFSSSESESESLLDELDEELDSLSSLELSVFFDFDFLALARNAFRRPFLSSTSDTESESEAPADVSSSLEVSCFFAFRCLALALAFCFFLVASRLATSLRLAFCLAFSSSLLLSDWLSPSESVASDAELSATLRPDLLVARLLFLPELSLGVALLALAKPSGGDGGDSIASF